MLSGRITARHVRWSLGELSSAQHPFVLQHDDLVTGMQMQLEEEQHSMLLPSVFGAHLLFLLSVFALLLQHPPPPPFASITSESQQDFLVEIKSSVPQHDGLGGGEGLALQTQFLSLQHTFFGATLGGEEQ